MNTTERNRTSSVLLRLRRSRSLASMLPSLLLSGVMTLVMTAFMQMAWTDTVYAGRSFLGAWMESWLTAWPFAFPVIYVVSLVLARMSALLSASAECETIVRTSGLAFGDIVDASARLTENNAHTVLRDVKRNDRFLA